MLRTTSTRSWIHYMLDVVCESATSTARKISSIRAYQDQIAERARSATRIVETGLLHNAKVVRERLFVNHEFLEVPTRAD